MPSAPQALTANVTQSIADAAPFWEFDEGAGSTSADGTELGHTAVLGTSAVGDNAEPTWIPGITGSALHFDGTNDYALVADASGAALHRLVHDRSLGAA